MALNEPPLGPDNRPFRPARADVTVAVGVLVAALLYVVACVAGGSYGTAFFSIPFFVGFLVGMLAPRRPYATSLATLGISVLLAIVTLRVLYLFFASCWRRFAGVARSVRSRSCGRGSSSRSYPPRIISICFSAFPRASEPLGRVLGRGPQRRSRRGSRANREHGAGCMSHDALCDAPHEGPREARATVCADNDQIVTVCDGHLRDDLCGRAELEARCSHHDAALRGLAHELCE